jgi:hypothetical protein
LDGFPLTFGEPSPVSTAAAYPKLTPKMSMSADEPVVNRRMRTVLRRAILPTAAALEHVHDPADHAAIVFALDATHISRQVRSNPCPLLVAQPKQVLAHDPDPLQKTNQDRIVATQELMSSDPSGPAFATQEAKKAH